MAGQLTVQDQQLSLRLIMLVMAHSQPWRNKQKAMKSDIRKKELESPGGREEAVAEGSVVGVLNRTSCQQRYLIVS